MAESTNQFNLADRELPIVQLLDALWHRVMNESSQLTSCVLWTAYANAEILESCNGLIAIK